ncbi:MAG: hypothetical protein AABY09_00385 [Nanoarchaeota archaeon]
MQMSREVISKRLVKEIKMTADLVSEIVGADIECEGLILSDYGNDYARHSYIPEQDADYASCTSYGLESVFNRCYRMNQRVLGIWHSHGSFDVFHSGMDDSHVASTIMPLAEKYNSLLAKKAHYPSKGTLEGILVSIVVNSRGDEYYAEEFCGKYSREVRLSVEEDSERIDEWQVVRSIGENVRYRGKRLSQYPNYDAVLRRHEGRLRKELNSSRIRKAIGTPNIGKISGILSGRASWRWEDRMREFDAEYLKLRNAENIHSRIPEIETMIEGNSYLIRKHSSIYSELRLKLSELKYRSWFKKVRKERYLAKIRIQGHRIPEPDGDCSRRTPS